MCGDDDEKDLLPTALLRSVGAVGKSEDAFFRLLYSVYEVALFCGARGRLGHPHT